MERTQLKFESLRRLMGSNDVSVVMLTDASGQRALPVVCDEAIALQLLQRHAPDVDCSKHLPEVLLHLLDDSYEIMIYGIHDGQYQVVLQNLSFTQSALIRLSDAVLLSVISSIPLYIETGLFHRQSSPYDANASGISIPINTMDVVSLSSALQRAVENEDYELASQIRDEIKSRKQ